MTASDLVKQKRQARVNAAKRLERQIAIGVIVSPFIGTIAALIWMSAYGITLVDVGLLIFMYAITGLGITAGFHRLVTHKSFKTGKIIQIVLIIAGSMAAQGPVLFWTACHRRHHASTDDSNDPHSPNLSGEGIVKRFLGLWHAHIGWMFNHDGDENWMRYVPDLLRDSLIFKINQLYFVWIFLGFLIPAILGGFLSNSWQGVISGFLWGGFVRTFLVHHSTWSINSICHSFGSRPYETKDESTNNFICAFFAFGEGWHNNHHAFQASAKHGIEWWQVDLTYWVINSLEKLGLASEVNRPSTALLEAKKRKSANKASLWDD
jgi:stearoyl-CoA desaturase (delta-9 desaturase)